MRVLVPGLPVLLLLAACQNQAATPTPATTATATASTQASSSPAAIDPDAKGRDDKVDNDLYQFAYSYPDQAARYPALREWLDARLEKTRGELESAARNDKAEAAKNDYPYRPHSNDTEWQVVTDLPGWLSLSAQTYTYSGGAHGMTNFDTLLWDKAAGKVREPTELFVSPAALRDAIQKPFCDALDRERAKRRGAPVKRDDGDSFNACIDPLESVVILGSKSGKTFDRLGVLVQPYAAGAYAEGTFEITLPITADVLRAVKPEFRGAFSS